MRRVAVVEVTRRGSVRVERSVRPNRGWNRLEQQNGLVLKERIEHIKRWVCRVEKRVERTRREDSGRSGEVGSARQERFELGPRKTKGNARAA